MPLDFPSSPTTGQSYTLNGRTWEWNGSGWQVAIGNPTPVTSDSSVSDVIGFVANNLGAVDAGSDKLVFWDGSAGKITYLTIGEGLTVSETTLDASGGGGGGGVEVSKAVAMSLVF
jgi:hypothetical protein